MSVLAESQRLLEDTGIQSTSSGGLQSSLSARSSRAGDRPSLSSLTTAAPNKSRLATMSLDPRAPSYGMNYMPMIPIGHYHKPPAFTQVSPHPTSSSQNTTIAPPRVRPNRTGGVVRIRRINATVHKLLVFRREQLAFPICCSTRSYLWQSCCQG